MSVLWTQTTVWRCVSTHTALTIAPVILATPSTLMESPAEVATETISQCPNRYPYGWREVCMNASFLSQMLMSVRQELTSVSSCV